MALMINDECANCGVCQAECPNDAISEAEDKYVINPDKCTECVGFFDEPQCAAVCPVEACVRDPNRMETREELLAKKVRLHGE